jgi:hypothetical protein
VSSRPVQAVSEAPSQKQNKTKRPGGVNQVVECLSSKPEALV